MSTSNTTALQRNPVVLVTGGTTGIGLSACKQLAERGVDVIFTSRTATKGAKAVQEIRSKATQNVQIRFITMELSDLSSVSEACDKFLDKEPYLDYLLLNAGIMGERTQKEPPKSADGIEAVVAVNHVASYFLAHKLLPLMERTAKNSPLVYLDDNNEKLTRKPMITFVSSDLHNLHSPTGAHKRLKPLVEDDVVRFLANPPASAGSNTTGVDGSASRQLGNKTDKHHTPYNSVWSYKYSKLLNVLTAQAIHEALSSRTDKENSTAVGCNSMEPGFIPQSDLSREVKEKMGSAMAKVFMFLLYNGPINWLVRWLLKQPVRTLEEGGYSEVFACLEGLPGIYYRLDKPDPPSPLTLEPEVVDGFYKATNALLREKGFPVSSLRS